MTTTLTSADRRRLRGRAHHLKPVVQIGKQGLSSSLLGQIERALADHELVKIRLSTDREHKAELLAAIEKQLDTGCVGTIGHVAILYRERPED